MREEKNKEYRLVRAQLNWRPNEGFDAGYLELETKMNVAARLGFKLVRKLEFEYQIQGPGLNDKITAIAIMEKDAVPEPTSQSTPSHWSDTVPGN